MKYTNNIKVLLAERDLSIKDLMNATGLSRNSLSNMANNHEANISLTNLNKLCQVFHCTPNDIYGRNGDK